MKTNRLVVVLLLSFLVCYAAVSQSKTALVTDFYGDENSGQFSPSQIPDYFSRYPDKTAQLRVFLDSILLIALEANTSYLGELPEMAYSDSLIEQGNFIGYKERLKKQAKSGSSDYYIRIRAAFGISIYDNDHPFELLLDLRILNDRAKKHTKKQVQIPFFLDSEPGTVYGAPLLDSEDFFELYRMGLVDLFLSGSVEETPVYTRLADPDYIDFTRKAKHYSLTRSSHKQIDLSVDGSKFASVSVKRGWPGDRESDGIFQDKKTITQKITLENDMMEESWKLRIKISNKELFNFLEVNGDSEIKIIEPENLGALEIVNRRMLKGVIHGDSIHMEYDYETDLTQFYVNNELVLLRQSRMYSSDEQVFVYSSNPDDLGIWLNLLMLTEEAADLIDASESDDD